MRLYAQVQKIETAADQGKGATLESCGGKPRQQTLRGSVICFRQESVEVCSRLLSLENMKKDLQLQFVGPEGGWDWLYHRCYGRDPARLVGEAHKIYSWLRVLSLVNPYYEDMTDLPPVEDIRRRLSDLAEELIKDSFKTMDDGRLMESMKARDDIARVRNAVPSDEGSPSTDSGASGAEETRGEDGEGDGGGGGIEGGAEEEDEGGLSKTPMRYVLVTSPDSTANENALDSVHGTLKSAAELFGVDVSREAWEYSRTAGAERSDDNDSSSTSEEEGSSGECLTRPRNCVAPSSPGDLTSNPTTSVFRADDFDGEEDMVRREATPVNEFTDGKAARCAAFPATFMFGSPYDKDKGPLTERQCRHCLLHFAKRAARERQFLFSEFDKRQRHRNCLEVHLKMLASKGEFKKLAEDLRNPKFQRDIKNATRDPGGAKAKSVLRRIGPLLQQTGKKTQLGAFERHDSMGEILAMGREYGSPTCMMTFAMDDVNSTNVVRMSLRSTDNVEFPTLAPATALDALKNGRLLGEGKVDCSYSGLAKLANENPVAVALEYKKIVMNVMETLVGIKPETATTKSFYRGWSNRGVVVGSARAFIGVTETQVRALPSVRPFVFDPCVPESNRRPRRHVRPTPQARGGLHFHVIIWGGLSPELLECVATVPELMDAVSTVIESQYRTTLPRELHVYDLIKRNKGRTCRGELRPRHELPPLSGLAILRPRRGTKRKRGATLFPKLSHGTGFLRKHPSEVPRALLRPPDPDEDWCEFVTFTNVTASVYNLHRHCFTCHYGVAGNTGCRLNMPRTKRARTAFVQIVPKHAEEDDFDEDEGKRSGKDYIVFEEVQPLHEAKVDPKDSLTPFSDLDPRVIAIEQGRPLLAKLPELTEVGDEHQMREEILNNFKEAMGYRMSQLRSKGRSSGGSSRDPFAGQPESTIPKDGGGFTADESGSSRDPNCLYSAMQQLLFLSGQRVPSAEVIRRRSLEYLAENRDHLVSPDCRGGSGRSLAEVIHGQSGLSVDQYCKLKMDADPRTCIWGEAVDVKLLATCFDVNVAVYREVKEGGDKEAEEGPEDSSLYVMDDGLSCIVARNESARTVRLVCREGLGGETPPCRERAASRPDRVIAGDLPLHFVPLVPTELLNFDSFFHIEKRLIDLLILELRTVSVEKLKELHESVSEKLVGRNGYVAEFNEVVSAALGVNTNSLFLGSREQSKSAIFYLGECRLAT